jgi:hypothetical protein
MKRIRIAGLCLVAMFAMSAVASASASAETPEYTYKTCTKASPKESGKYNNKTCTIESKGGKKEGDYELTEWNKGKKVTFTGKNGESTLDSYIPESESEPWTGGEVVGKIVCKSGKSKGELTGPKTSTVTVEFKSCSTEGKKCASAGEKAGTIKTFPLTSTLVAGTSGESLSLVEGTSGTSAEFNCEGLEVVTTGDLNGVNSGNVGVIAKEGKQTFSVNAKGGQEPVFNQSPPFAAFLLSKITPPGITLPSGENTTSTLKGEAMEIAP